MSEQVARQKSQAQSPPRDATRQGVIPRPETRVRFGRAIRIGGDDRAWSDIYVRLLDGSWWQLIGLLCGGWLLTNLAFAALFVLGGDCVTGATPGSFRDAFHFSVQTLSTIGYGTMAPKTEWAHTVVSAEALVSMLEVALTTGIIFAKFSRPRANVLFAAAAVVTRWQGQPALMFRVANRRGNDVVEASVRVSLLRSEVSVEGHAMRRLHDLKLVRSQSPVFTMSWTVMHLLDEDSPLYGLTAADFEADQMMLIATLTGHDGTYMQTVHARHAYHFDDVRWGHRYVDVMHTRDDGAIVLDFGTFHETTPEPEGA